MRAPIPDQVPAAEASCDRLSLARRTPTGAAVHHPDLQSRHWLNPCAMAIEVSDSGKSRDRLRDEGAVGSVAEGCSRIAPEIERGVTHVLACDGRRRK